MSDASYVFDAALDSRQIYAVIELSAVATRKYELAAFRYDTVQSKPCVDLIMYDGENDKIIVAIGLPVGRAGKMFTSLVWPGVFTTFPQATVQAVTAEVLRHLNGKQIEDGKLYPVLPLLRVYGAEYSDLIDERCCPAVENYWVVTQHMKRYAFVSESVRSGKVLDVASGSGYGASMLLSQNPDIESYTGADYDEIAIGVARKINTDPRAYFHHGDFSDIDDKFDWVISLETIEHVPDPDAFLAALKAKLAPGGRMIISLPCERWHGSHVNRYHWSSWNFQRVRSFLAPHFDHIEYYYYQRPTFDESPFDITTIVPFANEVDINTHEGYLAILESPRVNRQIPRLVLRRKHATGDVLLTTPVLKALRQKFPQHRTVVWTDATEIFADNPHADLVMCAWSAFQPAATDTVINLDEAYEREPQQHILAAYAKTADVTLPNPRLELYLAKLDYKQVQVAIGERPGFFELHRLIAVHMSTTHDRTWPKDYWDTLLQMLLADPNLGILALGAGQDFRPPHHVRIVDLVGRLDLRGTAAAVGVADILVGMDSSLLHIAGTVGTPAVGLYGLADPDKRAPFDSPQKAIQAKVPCAGCLHDLPLPITDPRCQYGTAFCNDEITPDRVYQAVVNWLMNASPLSWQARLGLGGGQLPSQDKKVEYMDGQAHFVEKIRYYERRLEEQGREVSKVRAELAWIEGNPAVKLMRRAKQLFK